MKMTIKFAFMAVIVMLLAGCHKTNEVSNDTYHTEMKYQDFDKIGNLTQFFDSIYAEHPLPIRYAEDSAFVDTVKLCIAQIDAYRQGQREFFPDSLTGFCIRNMGESIAAHDNHGPEFTDLIFAEWFIMCAAFCSPDITCLVDTQTPDHCAGFYNFGEQYNGNPWWSYIFLKREKGFEVVCLGDEAKVGSIYQLSDKQNRKYYLSSYNDKSFGFHQWLFMLQDDGNYKMVAECHDAPDIDKDFSAYYFDKNRLLWKFATEDEKTGKLTAVEEEPAMTLVLDGEKSRFK